jgi:hypothetical protein
VTHVPKTTSVLGLVLTLMACDPPPVVGPLDAPADVPPAPTDTGLDAGADTPPLDAPAPSDAPSSPDIGPPCVRGADGECEPEVVLAIAEFPSECIPNFLVADGLGIAVSWTGNGRLGQNLIEHRDPRGRAPWQVDSFPSTFQMVVVALDAEGVYWHPWAADDHVYATARDGSGERVLCDVPGGTDLRQIGVGGGQVVFSTWLDGLYSVPLEGGTVVTLWDGSVGTFAIEGSTVHFTAQTATDWDLLQVPADGGAAATLVASPSGVAFHMAIHDGQVFMSDGFRVRRTDLATGETSSVGRAGAEILYLDVDDAGVHVLARVTAGETPTVFADLPLRGGAATERLHMPGGASFMARGGGAYYWIGVLGIYRWVP